MPEGTPLSEAQRELLQTLVKKLGAIDGVRAVALGGSYARGRARPGSDIDLGLYYSEAAPFAIEDVRMLAGSVNDEPDPVVVGFYEWGPWVNGGGWLTIGKQRVDFLYRSLEHIERAIEDAEAGRYEHCYSQQPPFGVFSDLYLGEMAVCLPLLDPEQRLERLKRRVARYPEALRSRLAPEQLWSAEFDLMGAAKAAARGDTFLTAGCLTRAVNALVTGLFALNRSYRVNDKTALAEIADFEHAPADFEARVQEALCNLGASMADLERATAAITALAREARRAAGSLCEPNADSPAWMRGVAKVVEG